MKTKNIAVISVITIMALAAMCPILAGVKPEQIVPDKKSEYPILTPEECKYFGAILLKSRYLKPNDWNILKGIGAVRVQVEGLRPEIEKLGLTEEALQTDVELQLRKYGIEVVKDKATALPLIINVSAMTMDESRIVAYVAYILSVEYRDIAVLVRNPQIIIEAPVWRKGSGGTVDKGNVKQIREEVKDYVNQFINDYLAANPKEAARKKPETEQDK